MRIRRRTLAELLAFLVVTSSASAQADSVDRFVRDFISLHKIPGASVSVVHRGKVVKEAGYGLANLELRVPTTAHSLFEIGSITKQLSAEAVMVLVEKGKLTLDDHLSQYISGLPAEWSSITLRHLMTHTSGLHDWETDTTFSFRREYSVEEFVAFIARHPLEFAPGSRFAYSNSAFPFIGKVIERVSGMPYDRFVTERILVPAGMTETRFRRAGAIMPNRASGYAERDSVLVNGEPLRPAILAPNGGVLSSAVDMAKWNIALSKGTIVTKSSWEAMTTPTRLTDGKTFPGGGIAWFFGQANGHRFLVHNGSTAAGYSSVVYRFPDDDLSVVVLMNIDRFDAVNKLATGVAAFYVPGIGVKKP